MDSGWLITDWVNRAVNGRVRKADWLRLMSFHQRQLVEHAQKSTRTPVLPVLPVLPNRTTIIFVDTTTLNKIRTKH